MAPFGVQWEQLWYRTVVETKREPAIIFVRFGQNVFNGLLAIGIWWQVNGNSKVDIQNMVGVVFIMITNMFMGSFFASLNIFQAERPVFLREQANQMYGFLPYFLTKQIIEQPALIFAPIFYLLVTFWGVGFYNSWECFFGIWLTLIMVSEVSTALGLIISANCEEMASASAVSNLITLPSMMFAGLFANTSTMFSFLSWIQWLSPVRYAFEAGLISEFKPRGREYLYEDFLGFGTRLGYWKCQACMLGLTFAARLISLLALKLNIKKF